MAYRTITIVLLALSSTSASASDLCAAGEICDATSLLQTQQIVHKHHVDPMKTRNEAWAEKVANRTKEVLELESKLASTFKVLTTKDKQDFAAKAKDVKEWVKAGTISDQTAGQIIAFLKNGTVESKKVTKRLKEMTVAYAGSTPQKITMTPRERAIELEKEVWDSMDNLMNNWIKVQDFLHLSMSNVSVALRAGGNNASSDMVDSLMEPVMAISGDPEAYGLLGEMNYIPQYVWPFDLKTYPMKRIQLHVVVFERHLKMCQDMAKNFTAQLDQAYSLITKGVTGALADKPEMAVAGGIAVPKKQVTDEIAALDKSQKKVTAELVESMDTLFGEWYGLVKIFEQGAGHKEIYGVQGPIRSLMAGEKPKPEEPVKEEIPAFISTALGMFAVALGVGALPASLVLLWWSMQKRMKSIK